MDAQKQSQAMDDILAGIALQIPVSVYLVALGVVTSFLALIIFGRRAAENLLRLVDAGAIEQKDGKGRRYYVDPTSGKRVYRPEDLAGIKNWHAAIHDNRKSFESREEDDPAREERNARWERYAARSHERANSRRDEFDDHYD